MKKDGVTTKRSLRDVGAHSRPPHSWTSPGARGQPRRLAGVLEQLWSSPVVQQLPSSATQPCTFILSITDPLFYSRAPRPQVLVRWSRSTWGNFISAKLPPPFEKSARARITCFLNSSALVTDAVHWRALVLYALPHAECMMMLRPLRLVARLNHSSIIIYFTIMPIIVGFIMYFESTVGFIIFLPLHCWLHNISSTPLLAS